MLQNDYHITPRWALHSSGLQTALTVILTFVVQRTGENSVREVASAGVTARSALLEAPLTEMEINPF